MRCLRLFLPSFIFQVILVVSVFGQQRDIKFHHLTVETGLPSNTVNAVIRDSRGFIWIASENGVGRYDGYVFQNFRANEADTNSISSNITYAILEDRQNRLWVGSERGLDLYNRDLDRFDQHYFGGIPVRAIYQDSKNRLWIGSDLGLYQFDEKREQFTRYLSEMFDTRKVVYNTIPSITEDEQGDLWIGTSNGVFVFNSETRNLRHFYHQKKIGSLSDNNVRKIIQDNAGRIWIATYGGGLNLFQSASGTFKTYLHDPLSENTISSNLLPALWADESGKIWIGTDGDGLDVFDPEKETFRHFVHSPYNAKSLNNNVIRSINSDQRGGIWIGTYNGGINFYNVNAEAFFHYRMPTVNGNSSVTAFAEGANGNIWIGTDGGGLCYFNKVTGDFENFFHDETNANSLSDNRVISLAVDHNGEVWVGTYLGGLCRYNPKTKRFKQYREGDRSGLSDNIVWALRIDSENRLWAGTNKGLNLYQPGTDKFSVLNISNSNLSNDMVRCIFEDNKQRLWIGTQEGLNLLEAPFMHFTVIKSLGRENSLSNHWIRTINQDEQGHLWVGTFSGGLNLYDEMSNSFRSFSEADGLPDNIVSGILVDSKDNLWISTGRGLAYMDRSTMKFRNYSVSDGLQDNQYNINACTMTSDGEFLFGGNNGFTLFQPDVISTSKQNNFAPPIAFTNFSIFNRSVAPGPGLILHRDINESTSVTLNNDQNVITFEYAALNFIQPEKNQYAYMLEGFEKDWNMVGDKRSATYTNLAPGTYRFMVKASNNDGIWSVVPKTITVKILPPFWSTWWFRGAMLILFALVALLVINVIRARIREKIKINKLIAELEMKALVAQMNPHFIFNCLTSIQELIIVHKQEEAMHYLNQFSRLLRNLLQSSEKNFITLEDEIHILQLYLELEAMRFDKQFHYSVESDPQLDPEETIIPSFIIQPFVENALWHGLMHKTGQRKLTVSFKPEGPDVLLCCIHDNGIGREASAALRVQSFKTYQSLGIKIIRERIELMKQQNNIFALEIVDERDTTGKATGTRVIIRLPLSFSNEDSRTSYLEMEKLRNLGRIHDDGTVIGKVG